MSSYTTRAHGITVLLYVTCSGKTYLNTFANGSKKSFANRSIAIRTTKQTVRTTAHDVCFFQQTVRAPAAIRSNDHWNPFVRQHEPFERMDQPFERQHEPFKRKCQPFQRQHHPLERRNQPFSKEN